jgi:Uma2 family endonuclease
MDMPDTMELRSMTQRDLDDTPEDGNTYEVIDGELHVTPFPTAAHQYAQGQLYTILNVHVRAAGLGRVYPAGLKVVLDEPTGVGPDIVFISAARIGSLHEDGYYGAPDLVVEVLSAKPALDRIVKHSKYERAGIPHYWIVDSAERSLTALKLDGTKYRVVTRCAEEAVFEPELFPGLAILLADLWG